MTAEPHPPIQIAEARARYTRGLFAKLPEDLILHPELPTPALLVYAHLDICAVMKSPTGDRWSTSVRAIARTIHMRRSRVQEMLTWLSDQGYIAVEGSDYPRQQTFMIMDRLAPTGATGGARLAPDRATTGSRSGHSSKRTSLRTEKDQLETDTLSSAERNVLRAFEEGERRARLISERGRTR